MQPDEPSGNDRTQFMPRPGGRTPQPASAAPAAPLSMPGEPLAPGQGQGLNPLEQAAGPLLSLLTRLRNTLAHPAPASLRAQLLAYLREFEARAEAAGVPRNEVLLARYALCTALDEAVLSTPWGSGSDWGKQSLLITVHNEAWGGEKVFQLLEHCLQSPRERLNLLELLYLCTSLGFEGRYRVMPGGRAQLDALRERTAAAIRGARGEAERELSPHWRGVVAKRDRLAQFVPAWVALAIALAVLLLALLGLRLMLASDAEPVFRGIHALGEIPVQAMDRPVTQPKPIERPRLAGFLAEDIKAGRVAVEDAVDRSVVTIRGDELFASASASIKGDYQALLTRIAAAVDKVKGDVRITGHSDNQPIATLRFPSNWALSQARAEEVRAMLAARTGQPERFTAKGLSDTEPLASNATAQGRAKNRRVEITVLAEGVE
nr:DotU family type VI secretion system protein [uncultured Pseudomonas sp.]